MNCPCQSGEIYDNCCGRFITHRAVAENAQQLMRSRYSAYTLNEEGYLNQTWHADYRPKNLQLDDQVKWIKLDILDFSEQGETAMVEFEVLLRVSDKVDVMHEKSQFVFEQGAWFYTTGEMMPPTRSAWKPGRNNACPCGSGLKFKRCCGP